ncbi:c-type cytochrome biogenesis protein CcmI [Pseudooctadecabacter sp.]|uniref:c-type cytochrome biogenesis protein CcmI n=1 Tax=Pseudooctadecabacter sp. TaxID=1966338 RepID=UPI0035C7F7D3
MIWIIFAALSAAAVGFMLMSLRPQKAALGRSELSRAIFEDQLAEIDRDEKRGVISGDEATAARAEVSRNILKASRIGSSGTRQMDTTSRMGILLATLLVPAITFGYYAEFGNPDISSLSIADRAAERQERDEVVALASRLETELQAHPEGGPSEGWMLLGQTRMRLGDYERAADAYSVVAERDEADSAVFSMLAEALIAQEQGVVTPRADAAIARARELSPMNPAGTFYAALSLEQSGQGGAAHDLLIERLDLADGYYPWMDTLIAQANRIGASIGRDPISVAQFAPMATQPGPTQDQVAAAQDMSEEDRAAFIASMVDRLATRLEDEPDDLDGWLRLANAYTVLGRQDEAVTAYETAVTLADALPDTDPRKVAAEQGLASLRD